MIVPALSSQLGFSHFAAHRNLEGVDHETALRPAGERGGNSLNWVLGHVVHTRGAMLGLLDLEPDVDAERWACYGRGGHRDAPLPLDELVAAFDRSQERLLEALAAADEATLGRSVPRLFGQEGEEPAGVQLAAFLFHECYHVGQLGTIRAALGLAPAIQ